MGSLSETPYLVPEGKSFEFTHQFPSQIGLTFTDNPDLSIPPGFQDANP